MTVEKRKAVHTSPPAKRRDSSAVGLKAKLKITTTRRAKNSMELRTSRERHSRRRSLATLTAVSLVRERLIGGLSSLKFSRLHPGHHAAVHQFPGGEEQELIGHIGQQTHLMRDEKNGLAGGADRPEQ